MNERKWTLKEENKRMRETIIQELSDLGQEMGE
jgi:hypothetical protein